MKATTVIGCMVVLSTLMRFVQERRSNQAADAKALVGNKATVLRRETDDPADSAQARHVEAVAGACAAWKCRWRAGARRHRRAVGRRHDPGRLPPAVGQGPVRGQAAMTGESLPVEKFPPCAARSPPPAGPGQHAFMGTNVVSGSATAVVLATGNRTYFGTWPARVTATDRAPTAFQAGVNSVSWLLIRFMAVMVPLVLLINGFTKGDWMEAFLFALSVAVGLTPEMLPMIVTSTLAKGAVRCRAKVIVKRLDAIQNFGAMDVLCTDKTGTLTQDRSRWSATPMCGRTRRGAEFAYLNSYYQTGLKNLLDVAVLARGATRELDGQGLPQGRRNPVRLQRRRMSVVVAERTTT
jgi:Mg2+-importing ATPase